MKNEAHLSFPSEENLFSQPQTKSDLNKAKTLSVNWEALKSFHEIRQRFEAYL